ncbi:MAG TPA: hypothetical protein PKH77_05930 [Anaerolineae bacterium]|nr:hypothetical protein [Anaerolineae bacterium]
MSVDPALLERWLWLILSIGTALVVISARLLAETLGKRTPIATQFLALLEQPWLVHPLRLFYAIGFPAVALFWRGVLTERGLGLKPLSLSALQAHWGAWAADIGWGALIASGLWLIFTLGEWQARRVGAPPQLHRHRLDVALREAIYHQAHWAFYREPFVLLWGIFLGAWAGLAPVALEALINPARWNDLQSPARSRDLLVRVGLAVAGVLLYLQTQNLWVALLVDTAVGWALGQSIESNE